MSKLLEIIRTDDPVLRDSPLAAVCSGMSAQELLEECTALDDFRRTSDNLYERVRALFFLYAVYRFHLPLKGISSCGLIPCDGYQDLLKRRFNEAIDIFLAVQERDGANRNISSALAEAYHSLGFQTLADQVRQSVRSTRGNQWMFRSGHPEEHPLRIRPELLEKSSEGTYPILKEATPVRMDFTHSGWSDIFFLGMDFPEGARVINASIDLVVHEDGRDKQPVPPVEAWLRIIDEPVLRLTSVDLGCTADISEFSEVFDFARDYLGLLKAAVIAAGIVPPGMEGARQPLSSLLERIIGRGRGLEIVSRVRDIPKGSRLAVSTNLLASLIAVCMRATGQTASLTGSIDERERRLTAARAILGEWLGGSGGGWQDSGGVWPGIKLIKGVLSGEGDPEFGISRGRLLPDHEIFAEEDMSAAARQALQDSLVLVHGGMAQDVGPVLEMVTERYLLRSEKEWHSRKEAIKILDEMREVMAKGDIRAVGELTHRNFHGPIESIIPWAANHFTSELIRKVSEEFSADFWGFWMLGGMAGGGMGFIFAPAVKAKAQQRLKEIMTATRREMERSVPFAMDPVIYDFRINERGTSAKLKAGCEAIMPPEYYTLQVPLILRRDPAVLSDSMRLDLAAFGAASRSKPEYSGTIQELFDLLIPQVGSAEDGSQDLESLLNELGFDPQQHEQIRSDLKSGRIGLAQNRLPAASTITDVGKDDVTDLSGVLPAGYTRVGEEALKAGEAAVVSLAGGAGSRWTRGAGVIKSLNPFCRLEGKHRNFIEIHLAKSRRISRKYGHPVQHVFTTSYLTDQGIREQMQRDNNYGYEGKVYISTGSFVGLRLVPMARDLRFYWEEMPQQILDEQAQKVKESLQSALIGWALSASEGSDYRDNLAGQCIHPVGHWYEVPNLLINGTLGRMLRSNPGLKYLMIHNIDTLGADLDPAMLGMHIQSGAVMTGEVIPRQIEDRGGGLALVDGRSRLVEGMALPYEELEFELSWYNSATYWLTIDGMLGVFGLQRGDMADGEKVMQAVREMAVRMPTYITLKEVKKRWGRGQEDIFPVAQFEKLWGDMTALPNFSCAYAAVPRLRGLQLKDPAELDGWHRDGSAEYLLTLCEWE